MADPRLEIILAAKDITGAALGKFQGRIAAITKSVFSFKGALGSLVGAGGVGVLITKSLETADAIGKTADKLGIGTGALQEYRYAAERSGVSTGTLDMALQRFTRRTAEAAQGKGELTAVLKQYNIAVRDSEGKTRKTEEVFRELADVIQRTKDPAERLRIAFKAFDSEGAALVNTLRDGSGGLDAYAAKARDLGIILGDDLIRGSEKANYAVDDLGKVIEVSFSRVVLENVESITAAVEQLAKGLGTVAKYAGLRSITNTASEGARLASRGLIDWDKFIKASFTERQRMVDEALGGSAIGPDGRAIVTKKITNQPAAAPPGGWLTPPPAAPTAGGKTKTVPVLTDLWATYNDEQVQAARKASSEKAKVLQSMELPSNKKNVMVLTDLWATYNDEQVQAVRKASSEKAAILAELAEEERSFWDKSLELSEHTAAAMQENFSDLFFDAMRGEFTSIGDYVDAFFKTIQRGLADIAGQMATEFLFGDLGKVGGGGGFFGTVGGMIGDFFGGGTGGAASAATSLSGARWSPRAAGGTTAFGMAGGGYLGEGVVGVGKRSGSSYEFHPNEFVVPANKMGGSGGVVINNYSGLSATAEERTDVNGVKKIFVEIGNDILRGGPVGQAMTMRYGLRPMGKMR